MNSKEYVKSPPSYVAIISVYGLLLPDWYPA